MVSVCTARGDNLGASPSVTSLLFVLRPKCTQPLLASPAATASGDSGPRGPRLRQAVKSSHEAPPCGQPASQILWFSPAGLRLPKVITDQATGLTAGQTCEKFRHRAGTPVHRRRTPPRRKPACLSCFVLQSPLMPVLPVTTMPSGARAASWRNVLLWSRRTRAACAQSRHHAALKWRSWQPGLSVAARPRPNRASYRPTQIPPTRWQFRDAPAVCGAVADVRQPRNFTNRV